MLEKQKKGNKPGEYESLFMKKSKLIARDGKTVYIRQEFHERILKIVKVIGNNEISIFNFLDNVLIHHFDEFKEEIVKSYKEKNKDIF